MIIIKPPPTDPITKPMGDSVALPKSVPAVHNARGHGRVQNCRPFAAASLGGQSHSRPAADTKRSDGGISPAPRRHAKTSETAKTWVGANSPTPVGTKLCTGAAVRQP